MVDALRNGSESGRDLLPGVALVHAGEYFAVGRAGKEAVAARPGDERRRFDVAAEVRQRLAHLEHADVKPAEKLLGAIKTIIVADAVMSLDNVVAIAGAAEAADPSHRIALVIFGLMVSIPLIVWGSQIVLRLLDRYPVIVTLGGALLGWIAGGLIVNDPAGDRWPLLDTPLAEYGVSVAGAVFVVVLGHVLKRRNARRAAARPAGSQ